MARKPQSNLAVKIQDKFSMNMVKYSESRKISYNSLRMYAAGIYPNNKRIKQVLIKDGLEKKNPDVARSE